MAQRIYFGDIEVLNIKTRDKMIVKKQLYKELDKTTDPAIRHKALKKIKPKDRKNYKVTKLCFETAKYMGDTVY